jgi:tetratricopeptide (TPR) repeat protein
MLKRITLSLMLIGVLGCTHHNKVKNPTTPTKVTTVDLEPIRITATNNNGDIQSEAYDAKELFDAGTEAFNRGDFSTAEKKFTKVYQEFDASSYAESARYNAALALESQEKWAEALAVYIELVSKNPDATDAKFREAHCFAALEHYEDVMTILDQIEARVDLDGQRLIELHARKSQALFFTKDLEKSAAESAKAVEIYYKIREDEELDTDYYISMAHFYDAKVYGEKGRALPVRVNDGQKTLAQDLDDKAEFLLKAQDSYVRVLKIANRQFATMAGYEIGLLYEDFYIQIVNAPMPNELALDPLAQQIYREELQKEMKVLLEKSLRIYEKNILLGERVGLQNDFVKQSKTHLDAIKLLLATPIVPSPASQPTEEPTPTKKPGKKTKKGDFPGGKNG